MGATLSFIDGDNSGHIWMNGMYSDDRVGLVMENVYFQVCWTVWGFLKLLLNLIGEAR